MLKRVVDSRLPRASGDGPTGAGFSLMFDGSRAPTVTQGTYAVTHGALGRFDLFLARVGGGSAVQAVINRIR